MITLLVVTEYILHMSIRGLVRRGNTINVLFTRDDCRGETIAPGKHRITDLQSTRVFK